VYFAIKSLLLVGQFPPLDFIWCFKVFLWNSNILQSYIKCSDDYTPSSQGHIGLSINLNLWTYDFVFPWPETVVVNSDVIGIFSFSLCSTVGKNDLHSAPLSMLSHCLCHFVSPSLFSSVAFVIGRSSPITGLDRPKGFQEVKVPRFHDNGTGWW